MAACSLFDEDEVYTHKPGKGYSFGLVLENSEFLSSSDEDENEKPEDRLQKGTVRIAWHPTGKETVVPENKVSLVDRSLMPGDVVRRFIPGRDSQSGYVINIDVRAHMHVLRTNKYIYNVDSKDLLPLKRFESGQEVMLDSWLGRVENVNIDLVLVFPDGARCQVDENDIYPYDDVTEKRRQGEFSMCLYYPGQELKGPMDCLSEAKWHHSTPRYCSKVANRKGKNQTVHITIDKVVSKSVEVHWVFRGYEKVDNPDVSVNPPSRVVSGDDVERLKVLDWFTHCSIQIGDRILYRIKNDDLISTREPSRVYDPQTALDKAGPIRLDSSVDNKAMEDVGSATASVSTIDSNNPTDGDDADYEDMDDDDDDSDSDERLGACSERGLGSRGSKKKHRGHKGGGGGGPRHKVGKHATSHNQKGLGPAKNRKHKERPVGPDELVEVETEFTTSWATVMWQDGSIERDIPSVELLPVHHLDELEFFPGDFILPNIEMTNEVDYGVVVKADHAERTCFINWFKAYLVGKASEPTLVETNAEMSVYDIKDHPDYKFRIGQSVVRVGGFENLPLVDGRAPQAVGQVYELDPNGHLVIKWADGSISQCYPQEVFIVSDESDELSDNESWDSESDYDSDASTETWETESEHEIIGEENGSSKSERDDSGIDQGAVCDCKQELNSLLSRAELALARLQKLLNNFDVSVSAPECFHDIIRIYRSCHDLDKILQSSFFSDPDLQSLISQAKLELRRDKINKISKNLSQVFEMWSKHLPPGVTEDEANVGTVAVGGKTIKVGSLMKGGIVEVSLQVPVGGGDLPSDTQTRDDTSDAAAVSESFPEGGDDEPIKEDDEDTDPASCSANAWGFKKEISESAISTLCDEQALESSKIARRPSDPTIRGSKMKKDTAGSFVSTEANLVGENCVSKAPKRTKADNFDDLGHEAKKSRDDASKVTSHVAQDLCFKICQNLQKQILKIQEEVNKRVKRLMSAKTRNNAEDEKDNDGNDKECNKCLEECFTFDDSADTAIGESSASAHTTNSQPHLETESIILDGTDSVPHSVDEGGEKPPSITNAAAASKNPIVEAGGDAVEERDDSPAAICDPGNEASCEISKSAENGDDSPTCSLNSQKDDSPITLEDVKAEQIPCKGFEIFFEHSSYHHFSNKESQPVNPRTFRSALRKELKLFQSSLPDGIFVKGFEERLDLYSIMILGPDGTPYEDALFLFDIMLPNDYPTSPPQCFYYSFCSDRLNPNLYEDGKVCVSLLGTWQGKGNEVWTSKSNLLQVLLSIQGLILVPEPYYNEAGFERQRGTQLGVENSRMYNEMAILKTVQSLTRMCQTLPALFKSEIYQYLKARGPKMIHRLKSWMNFSEELRQLHGQSSKNSLESANPRIQLSAASSDEEHVHNTPTKHPSTDIDAKSQSENNVPNGDVGPKSTSRTTAEEKDDAPQVVGLNGDERDFDSLLKRPLTGDTVAQDANERDFDSELSSSVDRQFSDAVHGVSNLHIASTKAVQPEGTETSNTKSSSDDLVNAPSQRKENHFVSNDAQAESSVCLKDEKMEMKDKSNFDKILGNTKKPEFPLFPMSRGFCLTLQKHLTLYENALNQLKDPSALPPADEPTAQDVH